MENRNGIVRRYFPKKHNRHLTTQRQINKVVIKIDSTPMKRLGHKTPEKIFANASHIALAG
jgi:IS30 family transposase